MKPTPNPTFWAFLAAGRAFRDAVQDTERMYDDLAHNRPRDDGMAVLNRRDTARTAMCVAAIAWTDSVKDPVEKLGKTESAPSGFPARSKKFNR